MRISLIQSLSNRGHPARRAKQIHILAAAAALLPMLATADDWVPIDELVSDPTIPILDPEFDPVSNRVAWQIGPTLLFDGKLVVGDIDPDTGDILDPSTGIPLPQGGKGLIIDSNLVEINKTNNGPEWALSVDGSQIVYTKYDDQSRVSAAYATFDGTNWAPQIMVNGQNRFTPKGSRFANDPSAAAAYFAFVSTPEGPDPRLALRTLGMPETEIISRIILRGGNFLPGESAYMSITRRSASQLYQVFVWDYAAPVIRQVTFDTGSKSQSPELWFAPDLGDDMVFTTNVILENFSVARVYRRQDPLNNFNWALEVEIESPDPAKPYVGSPRPFVFEGKSYIVFMAEVDPTTTGEADIWIADLNPDPLARFYRKVSIDDGPLARFDPETYVTNNGPIIYYSRFNEPGGGILTLRRAQTGLIPTPVP
jgi:hypothetical protein